MSKKIPVIFGISGPVLTYEEKQFFRYKNIYGFILFKRNIQSEEQLLSLVYELRSSVIGDAMVFVDQEGGRVLRITPPIAEYTYPSAGYFANVYSQMGKDLAIKLVENNYKNLMIDLKKFSIDCPCAPVADLRSEGANMVVGDRSFGYDVDQVVELCMAAISGIETEGGKAVIKHIPGHGRAMLDSHVALPVVTAPLEELMETDFAVFKNLSVNLSKEVYAMTAHVIYNAIDPTLPATLSSKVIEFIRNEIGFGGPIITDDICMNALHKDIDREDQRAYIENLGYVAHYAISAGCDLVCHCSGNLDEIKAVYYALEFPIQEV